MKKTLVAMAALAAIGTASAQSSVTVFGVFDASYSINKGSVSDVSGIAYGNLSTSRIGFRGIEDIGGGLKAGFWLESEFDGSSGAGQSGTSLDNTAAAVGGANGLTFGRRATVSILGNFGEFRIGRDYVPTYANESDFSATGRVGVASSIITQVNVVGTTRSRASNGIQYVLPSNLGGFYGEFTYAFGEQADNAGIPAGALEDNGTYYGGRIGFKTGPFNIAASAGKTDVTRTGAGNGSGVGAGNTAAQGNDRSVANIGASYDFGVVKLFGLYSVQTQDNTVANGVGWSTLTAFQGRDLEAKAFAIGVTVPFGKGTFKAGYSTLDLENGLGAGTEPSADKIALSYQYDLSKRTALYASYARVKNNDSAAGAPGNTGLTAGGGSSVRQRGLSGVAQTSTTSSSNGFDFGIRHNF